MQTLKGILRSGCATSGRTCSTGFTSVRKRSLPDDMATTAADLPRRQQRSARHVWHAAAAVHRRARRSELPSAALLRLRGSWAGCQAAAMRSTRQGRGGHARRSEGLLRAQALRDTVAL